MIVSLTVRDGEEVWYEASKVMTHCPGSDYITIVELNGLCNYIRKGTVTIYTADGTRLRTAVSPGGV